MRRMTADSHPSGERLESEGRTESWPHSRGRPAFALSENQNFRRLPRRIASPKAVTSDWGGMRAAHSCFTKNALALKKPGRRECEILWV